MLRLSRSLCMSTAFERISSKVGMSAAELQAKACINLRGRALTAADLSIVAAFLSQNDQLEQLDLAANGFGVDGAEFVATVMSSCATLTSLHLDNNNLRGGSTIISEAVARHEGLRELHMPANVIGPAAAVSFAAAVTACKSLESLNLSSNAFGYKGGVAVAEALATSAASSKLQSLSLTACAVGMESAGERRRPLR